MASLSPRAAEKAAMLAVLNEYVGAPQTAEELAGQVDDPTEEARAQREAAMKLAGELLKAAFSILRQRELFVVGQRLVEGGPVVSYGWHSSLGEATKWAACLPEGQAAVVKVYPAGEYEQRLTEHQRLMTNLFGDLPCGECTHRRWEHGAMKFDKGVLVKASVPGKAKCSVSCTCKGFVEVGDVAA